MPAISNRCGLTPESVVQVSPEPKDHPSPTIHQKLQTADIPSTHALEKKLVPVYTAHFPTLRLIFCFYRPNMIQHNFLELSCLKRPTIAISWH